MSESFLNSISSFMFGQLLFWSAFLHLFVFIHFDIRQVSLSSSLPTASYLLLVTPTPLSVCEFPSLTMLHRFYHLVSTTRYQSLFHSMHCKHQSIHLRGYCTQRYSRGTNGPFQCLEIRNSNLSTETSCND